jgi:glycosyltransferase involved in cell wall biosynthesis
MKLPIAIIIPVHNSLPFIVDTIKTLYNSTGVEFKLILVESESNDGTAEFCDNLKRDNIECDIEVYHIPKKGLPNAINFGIQKAGDLDCYLTQDDVIYFRLYNRDWLKEMYEGCKNDEKIGIATTIFGDGVSGPDYIDDLHWVGTWSCYIPRRTINLVGLYDEAMGPGDDIDYSYRCIKAGLNFALCNYWVQHHRMTDHGNADSEEKQKKMGEYFRKKYKLGEFK